MCILCKTAESFDSDDNATFGAISYAVTSILDALYASEIDVRVVDPDHVTDTCSDVLHAIVRIVYAKHAVGVGVAPDVQEQHAAHVDTREAYRNMIGEQFAYALSMLGATQRAPLN
jgi:hypothetical protein